MAREWCGCGAGIRTWSYRRQLEWREYHRHPEPQAEEEPEMGGSHASVERRPRYFESSSAYGADIPIVQVKTGFQPT